MPASAHPRGAPRSLDELGLEFATIRTQGWAMQDEELAYGLRSVAAPVHSENGAVVAGANLAVQSRDWPAARITRELRPMVGETCAEISQLLGYQGR
jgi:IclR family transcriptional regulator, pca regulon regulatory protein